MDRCGSTPPSGDGGSYTTGQNTRNSDWDTYQEHRVVLLLDLDCFYAQCECVRLGFDARTTPLALLQWNSVLAVSYPARKFGIKRGDSWEAVREKSLRGKYKEGCYGVHVPLLKATSGELSTDNVSAQHHNEQLIQGDYESIFCLTEAEQREARKRDLGVRRLSSEGKASIERYRVASAKIFQAVREWIQKYQQLCGASKPQVVLERASIDEFFLDVTSAVTGNEPFWMEADLDLPGVLIDTVSVAESCPQMLGGAFDDDREQLVRVQRGCWVAREIRRSVFERLGFTLSAGISTNKTIAKLSASYGKPNGQAVTYPKNIEHLLNSTEIGKCRNFGGKLGSCVQKLLPEGVPTTMGAIRKYLPLPALQKGLSGASFQLQGDSASDVARWVYEAAHGVDRQPVAEKAAGTALTASVTAFKSFPRKTRGDISVGYLVTEARQWIHLVAEDVILRVAKYEVLHKRYPRNCTVQYCQLMGWRNGSKSVRIPFPPSSMPTKQQVHDLINRASNVIIEKEGKSFRLFRIGLCATEFFSKSSAIDKFLVKQKPGEHQLAASTTDEQRQHAIVSTTQCRNSTQVATPPFSVEDSDRLLAKEMQAAFDRENRLFQASEAANRPAKTPRIDSFFAIKK